MAERDHEQVDTGKEAVGEETALEEGAAEGMPAKGGRKGWIVAVAVIAASLILCTIIVCIAVAVAAFPRGKVETPPPVSMVTPAPTRVNVWPGTLD